MLHAAFATLALLTVSTNPSVLRARPGRAISTSVSRGGSAGPLIPLDVNSLAHAYIKDGALLELKGRLWTKVGAPPMNAAATVFGGKQAESVGPFTDADYFITPTAADASYLNLTGNFIITFVVAGSGTSDRWLLDHKGWYQFDNGFRIGNSGTYLMSTYNNLFISTGYTPSNNTTVHVVSFARAGASSFWKVDQNAVNGTGGYDNSFTQAYITRSATATLGRTRDATGGAFPGKFYEMRIITTTTPSAAVLDALHASIMN